MTKQTAAVPDANLFLTLALAAKLPTIHINTSELLHTREIIEFINTKPVVMLAQLAQLGTALENAESGTVFVTGDDAINTKIYGLLKDKKCTCIWVNTKLHPLHLITGQMVAPNQMVRAELEKVRTPECDSVTDLLASVGGLTLKDIFEAGKITIQRDGKMTSKGLAKSRQSYPQTQKGISQISSDFDFYEPPAQLVSFLKSSLKFFHMEAPLNQLAPRGILFDGPPGTGKTMGAKFIADHLGIPLFRLDIAGLKGKYVGDSEGALQAALAQLDQASPCVVLIDEVEKFFVKNAENNDSGVTTSLLGTMLWWLQEHSSRVLTVMTTNASKKIPAELVREGRVDQTMTFNGLGTAAQGVQFAYRVLVTLEKKFLPLSEKERSILRDAVATSIATLAKEGSIPQVKADQCVKENYKLALSNRQPE